MRLPLVAILPKDHGRSMPPLFLKECKRTVEIFHSHLASKTDRTVDPEIATQVVEAFTWFLADPREWSTQPATREELIQRFVWWRHRNIRGGPLEADVRPALDAFFRFVEERRLVAAGGGLGVEPDRSHHQGNG